MPDPDLNDLPHALHLIRAAERDGREAFARAVLTCDERVLRRRRLLTEAGEGFFVYLADVTSLDDGDAFELADGRLVEIVAAAEPVIELRGASLAVLAWHIGNRHIQCQIEADRLLVRDVPGLATMLHQIGAETLRRLEPFRPLGAAFGHGSAPDHDHGQAHAQGADGHAQGDSPSRVVIPARPGGPATVDHVLPAHGPFDD